MRIHVLLPVRAHDAAIDGAISVKLAFAVIKISYYARLPAHFLSVNQSLICKKRAKKWSYG